MNTACPDGEADCSCPSPNGSRRLIIGSKHAILSLFVCNHSSRAEPRFAPRDRNEPNGVTSSAEWLILCSHSQVSIASMAMAVHEPRDAHSAAALSYFQPPKQTSPSPIDMRAAELTAEDERYLALLEDRRDHHVRLRPLLSGFRVLALFAYEDLEGNTDKFVVGANVECANIGGALCAERSCIAQLQLLPAKRVRKVYIVSDADECLTPGTLCREFLSSSALFSPDTPFISRASHCRPCVTSLAELYPFPSIYDRVPRADVLAHGCRFCEQSLAHTNTSTNDEEDKQRAFVEAQLALLASDEEREVYRAALDATALDARDELFPLRYAAAVRFSDGELRAVWQHKTLEYGSSLDPISKLIPFIEAKQRESGNEVQPVFMLQVDQFGILHAPTARARAYFFEFAFRDLELPVHDAAGQLRRVKMGELVAESPECIAAATAAATAAAPTTA